MRSELPYQRPYDWAQVHDFLAFRAVAGVEQVDEHGYTRIAGGATISVQPIDGALELRVKGPARGVTATVRRVFHVDHDPDVIVSFFRRDPLLGPLVTRRPGLRIPGAWSVFECSVRAIVGQQVSVAAARTLLGRLVARTTHTGFPGPADVANASLEALGLTTARVRALKHLAEGFLEYELESAPAATVRSVLATVPGIGTWTIEYIALRALDDRDAFPASDLVLRRAAGDLTERELRARAEAWRPFRGYAALHLWRSTSD
jgi:AraC family transcriptional regulator, regulatory protein of adaptative response / DNA-3-methyladenine glycosylase II